MVPFHFSLTNRTELQLREVWYPAIGKIWPDGPIESLKARGGFVVDLAWKNAKLTSVTVHSVGGTATRPRLGEQVLPITIRPGETRKNAKF